MTSAVGVVEAFRTALFSYDASALARCLSDNAFWSIGGSGPLAGAYQGREAVMGLFEKAWTLSNRSLRPQAADTYDVLESEYHVALIDRWVADREGAERAVDLVLVMHLSDEHVSDGFHYVGDEPAFNALFGP